MSIKKINFASSSLWRDNNKEFVTKESLRELASFKSSKVNYKIALWNPHTNGVRYIKALIYNLCSFITAEDWKKMKRIKNKDFGNPIAITFNGESVDLDYFQALFEMNFISSKVNLSDKKILEIGAGYGRTCHAIVSNYNIRSYTIVDLENCLGLSRRYLKKVLTKNQFSKIKFFSNEEMLKLQDDSFDLGLNVDSFAEMDEEVVRNYLNYIGKHCRYFYAKNPVGKYSDKSLDNHSGGKRAVSHAMTTGLLRHIVDINDNRSVKKSASKFIRAYRPWGGWMCVHHAWAKPWSYYWQALYKHR